MEWSHEIRLTATRNVTIFPAFSRAGSETPGLKFSIRVTAIIHLQILLRKAACWKWKRSLWIRCDQLEPSGCLQAGSPRHCRNEFSTEYNSLFWSKSMCMRLLGIPALALKPRLCSGNFSMVVFTITLHALHCRAQAEWKQNKTNQLVNSHPDLLMEDYTERKRGFFPSSWGRESEDQALQLSQMPKVLGMCVIWREDFVIHLYVLRAMAVLYVTQHSGESLLLIKLNKLLGVSAGQYQQEIKRFQIFHIYKIFLITEAILEINLYVENFLNSGLI